MSSGGLVPSLPSDFRKSSYWESFFKKRVHAFEWYGAYFELCGILHRYIKATDRIMMAGCGNSELSENMFDAGLKSIVSVDISQTVIDQMTKRKGDRETLEYLKMDLTNLKFDDESFSVVVDKGTLDAIMSDDSAQSQQTAESTFSEYHRILKNGGRYICITLAQDFILRKLMEYFPQNGWLVRVHRVTISDEKNGKGLPVFAFVMTKFKNLPKKILEICPNDSFKPTRVEEEVKIVDFVKTQQHYVVLKSNLNKEVDPTKVHPPIQLFNAENSTHPRFVMNIVDKATSKLNCRFAVFIIPQGRESSWLFGSNEGRRNVAGQTRFRRVLFVSLNPWHEYGSRADLQDELNATVMDFAPPGIKPTDSIPYLSTNNEDLGHRIVRFKGESSLSGLYVVEDYLQDRDSWFRHLVFTTKSTVQTEIRLKGDTKSNKASKQKRKVDNDTVMLPDHSYLVDGYVKPVLAGILLKFQAEEKFKALMVGVGGGALSAFIIKNFTNCHLTAVEIDPAMIEVAQEWFGLPKDEERFQVHVADGIKFVEDVQKYFETDKEKEKYDIVVIDVEGNDQKHGLSCPTVAFLELEYLKSLFHVLKPDGLLMINLLCQSEVLKVKVMYNIRRIFKFVGKLKCETYQNELLYCFKQKPEIKPPTQTKSAKKRNRKKKGQKQENQTQNIDTNDNFDKNVKETVKSLNSVTISTPSDNDEVKGHEVTNGEDSIHDNSESNHGNKTTMSESLSLLDEAFVTPAEKEPLHLENFDSNLFNCWTERTKNWKREKQSSIDLCPLVKTVLIEQEVDYHIILK